MPRPVFMVARRIPVIAVVLLALVLHGPATDADAEETQDETFLLDLHCSRHSADFRSMEHEYLEERCWGHLGIHTYYTGTNRTHRLHAGQGTAFSVEQQLSPPAEGFALNASAVQVDTPLPIETSLDGLAWHRVAHADYHFVGLSMGGTSLRQEIGFSFELDDPQEFRYIRIRQPQSAAQGLSGFLDLSLLTLTVSDAGPVQKAPVEHRENIEKSCSDDIMEAVFPEHPCTYGGIDRWDAPSFFHTYPIGNASLEQVNGTALLAYWRPDDPGTCCGQTLIGVLSGSLLLQSSIDGVSWQTLDTFRVTYGRSVEFSVDLDDHEARFLRLVSEKHPGYWEVPPLKRPEGYLVMSSLALTGSLPSE